MSVFFKLTNKDLSPQGMNLIRTFMIHIHKKLTIFNLLSFTD